MTNRRWMIWGPLFVSGAAVAALVALVDFDARTLIELVARTSLGGLLLLLVLFALQQMIRAIRIGVLVPRGLGALKLLEVVLWHQFCLQLLPFHAGEFTLPELLARSRVARGETLAALIIMRMLDLLVAATLLALGLILLPRAALVYGSYGSSILAVAAVGLLVAALVFVGLRRWAQRQSSGDAPGAVSGQRPTLTARVWSHVHRFARQLGTLPRGRLIAAVTLSAAIGVIGAVFSFVFCRDLAPQVDWQPMLLIVLMMPLLSQIPLRGFAGIGTTEAYLVLLFSLAGLESGEALGLAVCGRLFHLGLISLGALAALAIGLSRAAPGRLGSQPPTVARPPSSAR